MNGFFEITISQMGFSSPRVANHDGRLCCPTPEILPGLSPASKLLDADDALGQTPRQYIPELLFLSFSGEFLFVCKVDLSFRR
jgi:hypothetical protein